MTEKEAIAAAKLASDAGLMANKIFTCMQPKKGAMGDPRVAIVALRMVRHWIRECADATHDELLVVEDMVDAMRLAGVGGAQA